MNETRTSRQVAIADHLWETLDTMSREMGTPVDALLNQAIFSFARMNGYQDASRAGAAPRVDAPRPVRPTSAERRPTATTTDLPPPVVREGKPPALRTTPAPPPRAGVRAPVVELRNDEGKTWIVEGDRFVIGRGKHCQMVIDSSRISREHAAIVHTDKGWFVEDLGSSNGTWFNKRRIDRLRITDGDEFYVCSERLRFLVR